MKYIFMVLAGSLLLSCANSDSTPAATPAKSGNDAAAQAAMADTSNYTVIQWLDSTEQHLGEVTEGQVMEISWRFKNAGDKPLVISNVHPGCGCTVAEKPEEPIGPGAEGVIKAKFDSRNQTNMQHKTMTVTANNKNKNAGDNNLLVFTVNVIPNKQ